MKLAMIAFALLVATTTHADSCNDYYSQCDAAYGALGCDDILGTTTADNCMRDLGTGSCYEDQQRELCGQELENCYYWAFLNCAVHG